MQNKKSNIASKLLNAIKDWENEGNKISDSSMFYYCTWFTGKKEK